MPDWVDRREEKLEELSDDLGLDGVRQEDTPETGDGQQDLGIDFSTKHVVRYEPVAPESPAVGDYTEIHVRDDAHSEEVTKKRPQCPACGSILTDEDDPLHLPGKCWKCTTHVCPQCRTDCQACGRIMCQEHSSGHGAEGDALCPAHAQDVADELRHERNLDQRQQDLQELKFQLEHDLARQKQEWAVVKQRETWAVERQQQRFDNRVTAAKLQLDERKLQMAMRTQAAAQSRRQFHSKHHPPHFADIYQHIDQITSANPTTTTDE